VKILIPTADYPPIEGGISTVTVQLARELAGRGHDVTVVAPYFPDMQAFDQREEASILRFRGYGLGRLRCIPMFAKTWPQLRTMDCLLGINAAYGGAIGWFGNRLFGKPYVTFAFAYEFLKFRRRGLAARLLRRIYAAARFTVAISYLHETTSSGSAYLPRKWPRFTRAPRPFGIRPNPRWPRSKNGSH